MKRKHIALTLLVLLSIGTAIGVYAGTVGVNDLFGFDTITADVEYYRNGVNYTQFIASRYGSDQSLNTTDGVTFAGVTSGEYFLNAVNKTDIFAYPQQDYSYTIWTDGTNYYAKNSVTGNIDFNGIAFDTVIQNANDQLSISTGGKISLLNGTFTTNNQINISSTVSLRGLGVGVTIIQLNSSNNVINATLDYYGEISHLTIDVNSNNGHGIIAEVDTANIYDVEIKGVLNGYDCLRIIDSFRFGVRDISMYTAGNGLHFRNEDNLLNYGNGVVENIFVSMSGTGIASGLKIDGNTKASGFNLMTFNYITAQTGVGHVNNKTGLEIDYGGHFTFLGPEFELLDNGIDIANSGGITIIQPYFFDVTTEYILPSTASRVQVIGDERPDTLDDGQHSLVRENRFLDEYSYIRVVEFYDDFMGKSIDVIWNQTSGTWAIVNELYGKIQGTTAGGGGSSAKLDFNGSRPFELQNGLIFEARFSRVAAATDIILGLSDGGYDVTDNFVGIWWRGTFDGNLYIMECNGTDRTLTNLGAIGALFYTVRYYYDPILSTAYFTIYNDEMQPIFTGTASTSPPLQTTLLEPHIEVVGDAKNGKFDFIYVVTGRYQ